MKTTLQDYKSGIKPVWCPGCGDYGVLNGLMKALRDLEIAPEDIMTISGIGCSGRFSHYLNTYSLHGTHGRALPTATGAKATRPDMTVLCVGGDGDGLGIGGGHIAHAARKNVDLTYILIDNRIYGLTKGQSSPTTPLGLKTKTSPYGVYETPMDPIPMFVTYDISFIARTSVARMGEMTDIMLQAIQHKGMSMVYVLSPCVTFPVLNWKEMGNMLQPLPEGHDKTNRMQAIEAGYSMDPYYTGIFYQVDKPVLEDHLKHQIHDACLKQDKVEYHTVEDLLHSYA